MYHDTRSTLATRADCELLVRVFYEDAAKSRATKMANALKRLPAGQDDAGSEATEVIVVRSQPDDNA